MAASLDLVLPPNLKMAWSTAACIPLEEGWLADGTTPQLTENGVVIPSQELIPSEWRSDQSGKWLKLHAQFDPGKTYKVWNGTVGTASSDTALPSAITLTPYMTDSSDNEYTPTSETSTTLEDGSVCKVVYRTGTMHNASVTDWLTYHIWIYYYFDRIDIEAAYRVTGTRATIKPIKTLGFNCTPPTDWLTYLRDEENRQPFERAGSTIVMWESGGYSAVSIDNNNFHAKPWEHSGEFLLLIPPAGAETFSATYATDFPTEGEDNESQVVAQLAGYEPSGRKLFVKFGFFDNDYSAGPYRAQCQHNPIIMPAPAHNCATGVIGPARKRSIEYTAVETAIESYYLSFNDQNKYNYKHNHWNTFGNAAERLLSGKPHLKRHNSLGHYPQHALAHMVLRGSGQTILDCFRKVVQFLRTDYQCDDSSGHARKELWGLSHGKAYHADGVSIDPDGNTGDTDFSRTGHWCDPYIFQLHWLIDHSYFSKQGYDGWASTVSFAQDDWGREAVETLAQAVYLYRYQGRSFSATNYGLMYHRAKTLIEKSIKEQLDSGELSPLTCPTWMTLALEVLQNRDAENYITNNARQLQRIGSPYVPYQIHGESTLAVMAHAVALGADSSVLSAVFPPLSPVVPSSGEQGPGPLGELHQADAWPVAQFYLGLDEETSNVALTVLEKASIQSVFPSPHVGRKVATALDKVDEAPTLTKAVLGGAAGLIMDAGEAVLDGSNPTAVTVDGMTSISAAFLTIKKATSPGDDPIIVTYDTSGTTLNIYAWKTDGSDPTLVASTNSTITVGWIAVGT